MRTLLALGLGWLLPAAALAALAPDSIKGKVFRERGRSNFGVIATFQYWESTIVLAANGRYRVVVDGVGSDLDSAQRGKVYVTTPVPDGTYTYRRVDEAHATLELRDLTGSLPRGGTAATFNLTFTSESDGFVNGQSGANGVLTYHLFTLSDSAAAQAAPVANLALRGRVAPGRPLIAGFVVPGTVEREVLIRAVGPSLRGFDVVDPWADPDFQIFRGSSVAFLGEAHADDWGTHNPAGMQRVFDFVGAFPLAVGSKDAADVVRLSPGNYTIVCQPAAADAGGEVLIEVYFLP